MTAWRTPWLCTPWESDPRPAEALAPELAATSLAATSLAATSAAKSRGRRPAYAGPAPTTPAWLYHQLTITGPAVAVQDFCAAARGSGVVPWQVDSAAMEEDVFNLAVSQPAARRTLDIEGCRILARQFRDRVEARQARAAARVGRSQACPFDLHTLLPVPAAILQQGPTHPAALGWLRRHWGVSDGLRQIVELPDPRPGRRLPKHHAVLGYGFFTGGGVAEGATGGGPWNGGAAEGSDRDSGWKGNGGNAGGVAQGSTGGGPWNGKGGGTPRAAVAQLAQRWPTLRLVLQPRPD